MIRIMQGDTYPIFVDFYQNGVQLTPSLISDIELCVGNNIRKTYSSGSVLFDTSTGRWYFILSQSESFSLTPGGHQVIGRIKYASKDRFDVKGYKVGNIVIEKTTSTEVI